MSWYSTDERPVILFGMMLYKMVFMSDFSTNTASTVQHVFFRDGIIYYFVCVVLSCFSHCIPFLIYL